MWIGKNLLDLGGPATDDATVSPSRGILDWTSAGLSVPALNEKRMPGTYHIPYLFVFLAISMVWSVASGPVFQVIATLGMRYLPSFTVSGKYPPLSHHCEAEETEPPKEIPWPMFHPIPTRPVFAGSPHQD